MTDIPPTTERPNIPVPDALLPEQDQHRLDRIARAASRRADILNHAYDLARARGTAMPANAPRNIPVPDQLAQVRDEIRTLETREAELKQLILANPDIREGAAWLAEVVVINTTYTDLKELRAMHADLCAEYVFPKQVTRVVLSGIEPNGEIVIPRAMRSGETAKIWRHTVNAITTTAPNWLDVSRDGTPRCRHRQERSVLNASKHQPVTAQRLSKSLARANVEAQHAAAREYYAKTAKGSVSTR